LNLQSGEIKDLLNSAREFAQEASRILISRAQNIAQIDYKGRTDLVTDVDRESEALLVERIRNRYPDHGILAEESGQVHSVSEITWVIDPLDGTTNFVHGYPAWGVSVAVTWNKDPIVGVITELPANHLYSAMIEGGAWCDDSPIQVSRPESLEKSLLVTGFGYEHGDIWHKNMNLFRTFTDRTQGVRRLGSAAIDCCHAASGIVDGYWELDIKPWDIAAGVCIAREAGARVSTPGHDGISIFQGNILIASPTIYDVMALTIRNELSARREAP